MPDNRTAKNRTDLRQYVTAENVRKLREDTGESMMDCKKALAQALGDMERAKQIIHERGRNCTSLVTRERPQTSYSKGLKLMRDIWNNWSIEDKQWFLKEHPINMHSTLGRHLRNHCGMWEVPWTPVVRGGIDYSKQHPDAISQEVIKDFHEIVSKTYPNGVVE